MSHNYFLSHTKIHKYFDANHSIEAHFIFYISKAFVIVW